MKGERIQVRGRASQNAANRDGAADAHPFLGIAPGSGGETGSRSWDVELGTGRFPYLADHCFQEMIVLPGSVYVEMAWAAGVQAIGQVPTVLRDVQFHHALVLPDTDLLSVRVDLATGDEGGWRLECYSRSDRADTSADARLLHASAEIPGNGPAGVEPARSAESLDTIRARCPHEIYPRGFYRTLRASGNQYGPRFQGLERLWRGPGEALAKVSAPARLEAEGGGYHLHPALLDACTQVLAAANRNPGFTYVLTGFDEIRGTGITRTPCWSHARLDPAPGKEVLSGDIRLLGSDGETLLELLGVRFKYLEYEPPGPACDERPAATIALAATFTEEPVEDAIRFWGRELGTPFNVEFAPYNQVFQQQLDPSSLLARNHNGLNVVLLRFEDWLRDGGGSLPEPEPGEKERLLADRSRFTLPNHAEIADLNHYETEYLYKEIFQGRSYLKHGITISDGDCVMDVGANIGMFTLFVQQQARDATVYAFEPAPPAFEVLDINTQLYGPRVRAFNCGVSGQSGEATFTYYERSSVFSSFSPDTESDKEALRAVLRNMLRQVSSSETGDLEEYVDDFMEGRLESQSYTCPLKTLSQVIGEQNIQRIDLLKVDAEKSELAILQGIDDGDWPKIRQLVMEVHDKDGGTIEAIRKMLGEKGFSFAIEEERLLQQSGLYNVFATRGAGEQPRGAALVALHEKERKIHENVTQLALAMRTAVERSSSPYLVCTCPASPAAGPDERALYDRMEDALFAELGELGNVYALRASELERVYPVSASYDPHGDELGHVPYTETFFAALGTMLVRKFRAIRRTPYKVVVLDCDQTLWKGVCGEDGPDGIEIDAPRRKLQEFMVKQLEAGMLLCLCSKNSEEDVAGVFEHHPEMPLKPDHFVARQINWGPKSANIRTLAADLQLGLDGFIFVDDNPVECAEVRAGCPEVLTLQLPQDAEEIPGFLEHVWAFDHLKVTEEDRKRTDLYKQNATREHFRRASLTLDDFLDGLNLRVRIFEPGPEHLPRISQLTQRTNQFNMTTSRRSETEIRDLCRPRASECLAVEVSDRFGDYGLVGLMLYAEDSGAVTVDTFLLSCRVLGRGVEHQMLARLGAMASERGLGRVELAYRPTPKNRPALDFLEATGSEFMEPVDNGFRVRFPAERARDTVYKPAVEGPPASPGESGKPSTGPSPGDAAPGVRAQPERLIHIATNYNSADRIRQAVEDRHGKQRPDLAEAYVAPGNEVERSITAVWQSVLGLERVGIDDNFSEIGGTSLKAVQLIARLKRELKMNVSIVSLFESPTIRSMVAMLTEGGGGKAAKKQAQASRKRGEKRRARKRTRSQDAASKPR